MSDIAKHWRAIIATGFLVVLSLLAMANVLPRLLVLDNCIPSDLVVVLDGHDTNYFVGVELLRRGFAKRMFVCPDLPDTPLTGTELQLDQTFVRTTAGELAGRIDFCSNTPEEDIPSVLRARYAQSGFRSVILISPEAHSRAQVTSFRRQLPGYHWSVKAVPDVTFNVHWWRKRRWTKTFISALVDLFEALRTHPVPVDHIQNSSLRGGNLTSAPIAPPVLRGRSALAYVRPRFPRILYC